MLGYRYTCTNEQCRKYLQNIDTPYRPYGKPLTQCPYCANRVSLRQVKLK